MLKYFSPRQPMTWRIFHDFENVQRYRSFVCDCDKIHQNSTQSRQVSSPLLTQKRAESERAGILLVFFVDSQ